PPPIYTLSLHDALPISSSRRTLYTIALCFLCCCQSIGLVSTRMRKRLCPNLPRLTLRRFYRRLVIVIGFSSGRIVVVVAFLNRLDRKSTRLNSSHVSIS